jgi:6-phosphogluconolactonase/glucosamine-6-phosphate isomerase/deaminase
MSPTRARAPLQTFPDREALAAAVVDELVDRARPLARGATLDVLLGLDASARAVYDGLVARRDEVPWSRVRFALADEWRLPPEDPRTRYHVAYHGLFSRVALPAGHYWRPWSEGPDGRVAAAYYESMLRRVFDRGGFDLALLELGARGDLAAIDADFERASAARTALRRGPDGVEHLGLTALALGSCRDLRLIAVGASVAGALRDALDVAGASLAACLARECAGSVRWLADRPAASALAGDVA